MSAKQAEAQVWNKLYEFVMNPDFLLAQVEELARQLQQNYEYLQKTRKQLLEELQEQFVERQEVITAARKMRRTDDQFGEQMRKMYAEEDRLKRRLALTEQKLEAYASTDWEAKTSDYVADLRSVIEELNNSLPQTPEEQHRTFLMKKRLVNELVAEANIDGNREIQVKFQARIVTFAGDERVPDPLGGDVMIWL